MNFASYIFFNDINHDYRAAILKKNYLWLLSFFMAVATHCCYEKVRRNMRNVIVSYLNNSTYFYFLVFNRLVNKNYNHLILLFKIIINAFFGNDNSLFGKVLPNICKNSFLNSPNFFPAKLTSLKVYKMFLGKRCREVFRTQLMKILSEIVNVF